MQIEMLSNNLEYENEEGQTQLLTDFISVNNK